MAQVPPIKAAVAWPNGKTYLFQGTEYKRFTSATGTLEQSGLQTSQEWSGLRSHAPDAGVLWGFGKAYFFYGGDYVRYDVAQDKVEPDYLPPNPPFKLSAWPGLWTDRVDAAMNWGNGKIYFFRDGQYIRYDITFDRADAGYPKSIAGNWPGVWTDRIDACLYPGGDKAYFFRDDRFRRFDIPNDNVDLEGSISSVQFDPVPGGMWKSARELSLDEANLLVGFLIEGGKLSLGPQTPFSGSWQTGITSPAPATHVVVQPATIGGVAFHFGNSSTPQPLLDNVDQRMLVVLAKLTRWLNASEPDVTVIRHLGIGHGVGPPNDCHNQGRALDFAGIDGESQGSAFTRSVLKNWGNLPVVSGVALRLDPSIDALAHLLFLTSFRFGTYECECNGIGTQNSWPPKDIGDPGGFVIHPDYVDVPPQVLRPSHQDHIHMQVGKTLA